MTERIATIKRDTKETSINIKLNLDGNGRSTLKTDIPFFDHMLDLFCVHGNFDLDLTLKGDIEIDYHHSVEDVGICLGKAFHTALGDFKGIKRYSSGLTPMDESLSQIAIDISNRPFLSFDADFPKTKIGTFDIELVEEFFNAFVINSKISLHIKILTGTNLHHMVESCFKGFGRLLSEASQLTGSSKVPSSKGLL
ncbi:imidazoleglycerol-phosphate dehydratase HisB [bacterium]|jgi:imidazoleglycerol-phosphate dehydratase|nr:imidazoleglycerol-phosphate dehydratase HisB [bacterium]